MNLCRGEEEKVKFTVGEMVSRRMNVRTGDHESFEAAEGF